MLQALLLIAALLPQAPDFTVKLHADRTAVAPGATFRIAAEITIARPWHMYHPVVLETGLPTVIKIDSPAGVDVGRWQFPEPMLGEAAGIEYLSLKGTFTAIASVNVDSSFAGDEIALAATATGLACIEQCIPVDTTAKLRVPIGDDGEAANAELFKKAAGKFPQTLAKAEYLSGSEAAVSHAKIPVGGSGTIAVRLKIQDGHHIQDRDPGNEDLIAARVWIEKQDGLEIDEDKQRWPTPHTKKVPGLGTVREQSGTIVILAPFAVDDSDVETGPVDLQVLVRYQACLDDGTCYMPMMAATNVAFEIVPAGEEAVANDAFKSFAESAAKQPGTTEAADAPKNDKDNDKVAAAENQNNNSKTVVAEQESQSLLYIYFFAFLGGLILNIMPCVLPVISLKVFSFVNQAQESRGRVFALGLAFAAGVLMSFLPIAILVARSGESWGTLLQTPGIVIGLIAAVFAFGLSLLGVFEFQLPGSVQNVAGDASTREGFGGAFLNGVFATALATPCVGPFLGGALGALTTVPPVQAGIGIMFVGLGLAFPYLLLTAFPGWMKFMPKPGAWMETFKQFTGLIMMVVVVWLLWILYYLLPDKNHYFAVLLFLVFVAGACWVIGRVGLTATWGRTIRAWVIALMFLIFGWFGSHWWFSKSEYQLQWYKWEPGLAEQLADDGYTVYVDYTAKWCTTCQVNKARVLNTEKISSLFADLNVVPLLADFTNQNEEIQESLQSYQRNGVPLNIVLPAGAADDAIVLPEVLTKTRVAEALKKAGASKAKEQWADGELADH